MNCIDYREWLSAYTDGALDLSNQASLEEHLKGCPACNQEAAALRQMVQDLRSLSKPQVPDLLPGIHRRLQPAAWWQSLVAPWPVSLPWHGLALATTALLVVLVARPKSGPMLARTIAVQTSPVADELWVDESRVTEELMQGKDLRDADDFKPDQLAQSRFALPEGIPQATRRQFESKSAVGASFELASAGSGGYLAEPAKREQRVAAFGDSINGGRERLMSRMNETAGASSSTENPSPVRFMLKQFSADKAIGQAPGHLQLHWQVEDVDLAVADIIQWAETHEGFAVVTTPGHLSVMLPAKYLNDFLIEFSGDASAAASVDFAAPWMTVSVELAAP